MLEWDEGGAEEARKGKERNIRRLCKDVRRIDAINLVRAIWNDTLPRFGGIRCRSVDASAVYRTMENSRSDNRTVDGGGNPSCSACRLYENNEIVHREK